MVLLQELEEQQAALQAVQWKLQAAEASSRDKAAALSGAESAASDSAAEVARLRDSLAAEQSALAALQQVCFSF